MSAGSTLSMIAGLAMSATALPCAATCTVSAVSVAFGNYDTFRNGPADVVGNIAVTCIAKRGSVFPYTIALNAGAGTFGMRSMRSGSMSALRYNLYLGADRSVVWGDGNGGTGVLSDTLSLDRSSVTRNYPVYARLFARQNVPVGIYIDSIVVTLEF